MATHTCNQNCGCNNTYTVTAPCPPACPEVFNAQCIVYTGTDIYCNQDLVIKRYDYLDTVITKLVNYLCNVEAPVSVVVGSEYIDVVPNVVGNVTTYTVYVDVPALQAYFDIIIAQTILASILAGPGIDVAPNPVNGTVTISHEDTSSVASPLSSNNSGNTFIQDINFTFDTYGHVTGASVVPGNVIPPNDFDRATVNPDSGFVWGPNNDPTNIQIAEAPGDTLNFVAGVGIILNGSTVPSTDAIRITNSAPDQIVVLNEGAAIDITGTYPNFTIANTAPDQIVVLNDGTGIDVTGTYPNFTVTNTSPASSVTLTSAGGTETLVNDGTGPSLATKGLTAGNGISLSGTATDVTIAAAVNKYTEDTSLDAAPTTLTVTHNLNSLAIILSIVADAGTPNLALIHGTDYEYKVTGLNTVDIESLPTWGGGNVTITVIG